MDGPPDRKEMCIFPTPSPSTSGVEDTVVCLLKKKKRVQIRSDLGLISVLQWMGRLRQSQKMNRLAFAKGLKIRNQKTRRRRE